MTDPGHTVPNRVPECYAKDGRWYVEDGEWKFEPHATRNSPRYPRIASVDYKTGYTDGWNAAMKQGKPPWEVGT